jgi:hypothetical protein
MQASNYPDGWLGGWMDAETVNQVKIVAKKQHHEYHQSTPAIPEEKIITSMHGRIART